MVSYGYREWKRQEDAKAASKEATKELVAQLEYLLKEIMPGNVLELTDNEIIEIERLIKEYK